MKSYRATFCFTYMKQLFHLYETSVSLWWNTDNLPEKD